MLAMAIVPIAPATVTSLYRPSAMAMVESSTSVPITSQSSGTGRAHPSSRAAENWHTPASGGRSSRFHGFRRRYSCRSPFSSDHPVASLLLCQVEVGVSLVDDGGRFRAGSVHCDADADGSDRIDPGQWAGNQTIVVEGSPELLGSCRRAGAVNPGKEDQELLASPAGDDIGGPHASGEQVCCLPQDPVTFRMAEAVVDRLEVVDIGDQNRPSVTVALGAG
jgi:hypothetical protein